MLIIVIIIISSKATRNVRILKIPATQSRREALMQPSLIASTLLTEISNKPRTQNFQNQPFGAADTSVSSDIPSICQKQHGLLLSRYRHHDSIPPTIPILSSPQSKNKPKNSKIARKTQSRRDATDTYLLCQPRLNAPKTSREEKQKPRINPPETYKRFHHDSPVSSSSN